MGSSRTASPGNLSRRRSSSSAWHRGNLKSLRLMLEKRPDCPGGLV